MTVVHGHPKVMRENFSQVLSTPLLGLSQLVEDFCLFSRRTKSTSNQSVRRKVLCKGPHLKKKKKESILCRNPFSYEHFSQCLFIIHEAPSPKPLIRKRACVKARVWVCVCTYVCVYIYVCLWDTDVWARPLWIAGSPEDALVLSYRFAMTSLCGLKRLLVWLMYSAFAFVQARVRARVYFVRERERDPPNPGACVNMQHDIRLDPNSYFKTRRVLLRILSGHLMQKKKKIAHQSRAT